VEVLNCKVAASEEGQRHRIHPKRGVIHLDLKTGSPLMNKEISLKLLDELEAKIELETDIEKVIEHVLKRTFEKLKEQKRIIDEEEEKEQLDEYELSWWGVEHRSMLEEVDKDDEAKGKNFVLEAAYRNKKDKISSSPSSSSGPIIRMIQAGEETSNDLRYSEGSSRRGTNDAEGQRGRRRRKGK
jgi:hypothetical protein